MAFIATDGGPFVDAVKNVNKVLKDNLTFRVAEYFEHFPDPGNSVFKQPIIATEFDSAAPDAGDAQRQGRSRVRIRIFVSIHYLLFQLGDARQKAEADARVWDIARLMLGNPALNGWAQNVILLESGTFEHPFGDRMVGIGTVRVAVLRNEIVLPADC